MAANDKYACAASWQSKLTSPRTDFEQLQHPAGAPPGAYVCIHFQPGPQLQGQAGRHLPQPTRLHLLQVSTHCACCSCNSPWASVSMSLQFSQETVSWSFGTFGSQNAGISSQRALITNPVSLSSKVLQEVITAII